MMTVELGQITDTVMGQAPPGEDCNKEGKGTIFVKAGEFRERFPVAREWTTNPLKFAKSSDVLVCVVGATAGKVNQGIDCAIGRSVAAVRPRNGDICTEYLYHFLSKTTDFLRMKSQGLAQGVITRDMLNGLQIPLPPPDEQKRIAAILDQADELRRLRQRAIDRLNELGQAIFYDMFGDPAHNPKNLPKKPLGSLIKVSSGEALTAEKHKGGPYPVYGGNGINGWHDEFRVPEGTIIIGRVGVYCGAIHVTEMPAWVTDNALIVTKRDESTNTAYLSAALRYANLNQYAGRSAQPLVSGSRIYPVEILVPETDSQNHFEVRIADLDRLSKTSRAHLAMLEGLFSSLQHRAFRSEL